MYECSPTQNKSREMCENSGRKSSFLCAATRSIYRHTWCDLYTDAGYKEMTRINLQLFWANTHTFRGNFTTDSSFCVLLVVANNSIYANEHLSADLLISFLSENNGFYYLGIWSFYCSDKSLYPVKITWNICSDILFYLLIACEIAGWKMAHCPTFWNTLFGRAMERDTRSVQWFHFLRPVANNIDACVCESVIY